MRVFNACVLIIRRHAAALFVYFGLFMVLSVVMPALSVEQFSMDFALVKPNFTIINRDGGTPLSDGLAAYLRGHGNEVALEDRKEALQDAAFYHATDFIAILPQGFHDAFYGGAPYGGAANGGAPYGGAPLKIETVVTTESAKGYYVDSLIGQYLDQVRMRLAATGAAAGAAADTAGAGAGADAAAGAAGAGATADAAAGDAVRAAGAGMDEEALVAAALLDLSMEARVEVKRFGASAPVDEVYRAYSRLICYIIVVLVILCTSNITSAFRRPDVRMRNLCAPAKTRSMSGQQILCCVLVGAVSWMLLMALGFAIYGSRLAGTDGRIIGLLLLNSFVVTLVALSIASLACQFIKSPNSQNAVANFLSLGLCFLSGVFVPLELLGDSILAVARFTPFYWYVTALGDICALTSFGAGALAPIWQAMLTQLAFAAAIICVALVVNKQLDRSERSFSSVRTELDA